MDNQIDIMRSWIKEALRSMAKGGMFSNSLIDQGFDLIGDYVVIINKNNTKFSISHSDYDEMKDLYENQQRKIQAIKIMRDVTGWGLKDAKEAIEDSRNFKQTAHEPAPY